MKNTLCALLLLIVSCKQTKSIKNSDTNKLNATTKINYTAGACFGRCPIFKLEIIGATKTMTYVGEKNCEKLGTFTKNISDSLLANLITQFEDAKFNSLNDEYLGNITDFAIHTINYERNGKTKSIKIRSGAPSELTALQKNIIGIANSNGWLKMKDAETH